MLEALDGNELSALIGLIGGILLGLAARMGRFCTLGAIEDATYGGSQIRVRMWSIALGLSIISVHFLSNFGLINSLESLYLSTEWNPYSSVVGGLLFGYGMAICGNCGYGALARLGGVTCALCNCFSDGSFCLYHHIRATSKNTRELISCDASGVSHSTKFIIPWLS